MTPLLILMASVTMAYADRAAVAHVTPMILSSGLCTREQMSWILAAFGIGYVCGLPFSGVILSRLGHTRTLAVLSAGWVMTGLGFALAPNPLLLGAARFGLGLVEAPLFPLFVSWIALQSAPGKAPLRIALVEGCSYVGMGLVGPLVVALAMRWGWRSGYAVVSLGALLILAGSFFLTSPSMILTSGQKWRVSTRVVPSWPLIAAASGFLLYNLAKNFYSTWFPTVLVQDFGFTSWSASKVTATQSILGPLASLGAAIGSSWLHRRRATLAMARLVPICVGFLVGALLSAAVLHPDSVGWISVFAFAGLIGTSALIWNVVPDLVGAHRVGMIAGWVNGFANLGTILSPLVVGGLLRNSGAAALLLVTLTCVAAIPAYCLAYRVPDLSPAR